MTRRRELRELAWLCAIGACVAVAQSMTLPLVALYSQALGATSALIGVVLGTGFVLPVLTAVYLGGWVERLGAPRMIFLGALGLATAPLIPALLSFGSTRQNHDGLVLRL